VTSNVIGVMMFDWGGPRKAVDKTLPREPGKPAPGATPKATATS